LCLRHLQARNRCLVVDDGDVWLLRCECSNWRDGKETDCSLLVTNRLKQGREHTCGEGRIDCGASASAIDTLL